MKGSTPTMEGVNQGEVKGDESSSGLLGTQVDQGDQVDQDDQGHFAKGDERLSFHYRGGEGDYGATGDQNYQVSRVIRVIRDIRVILWMEMKVQPPQGEQTKQKLQWGKREWNYSGKTREWDQGGTKSGTIVELQWGKKE